MKKTTFFEALKMGLGLIPSRLLRFIKKIFVNLWFYAYISLIPILIAFVGMYLVKTFTQNTNAAGIVFKILATIGQIIPLSFSLYISEYELIATDEDSAELCFAICAVVISALWLK
jgi:hypothetical protein